MGDSYRPPRTRGRQADPHDDYRGAPPPPPPRDYQPRSRSDMMESRRYPPPRHQPPPRDNNIGFQFRGAAASDSYRPPEQPRFDFRADSGRPTPRFPQEQPPPRESGPPRNRGGRNSGRGQQQRGNRHGGPPRRKFIPKPAHDRAILKNTDREPTPEQLVGMEPDHQPKFAEYISSSEDEASAEERNDADGEGPRKRAKVEAADQPARPQWSNPDPYSVLPPTDMGIGPKKDIVQTIRKAKVDAAANQANSGNAVKENVDFISFDFGNDTNEDSTESGEIDSEDLPSVGEAPPSPVNLPTAPPAPAAPTEDEAMRALTGEADRHAQRGAAGKKRKHDFDQPSPVGIMQTEWAPSRHYPNSTPWYNPDGKAVPSDALRYVFMMPWKVFKRVLTILQQIECRDLRVL